MGVWEQISVLAGSPTKHGIDMDGGDEAAEAVAEEVAAHSTRAPLSTET